MDDVADAVDWLAAVVGVFAAERDADDGVAASLALGGGTGGGGIDVVTETFAGCAAEVVRLILVGSGIDGGSGGGGM